MEFEEDTDKSHQKINAFKICLSIGKLLLNNSYQLNERKILNIYLIINVIHLQ